MILKIKEKQNSVSPTAIAGENQELNVAFYLRRAFKDDKQVHIINDLRFTHNGESAQIDHLVIHPFGFILIESKSIAGFVKVNERGEWSRTIRNKWQGMPSPIKQVELQEKLLKEYLHCNREIILPKFLGMQQSINRRQWHGLCAVSSNAVLDRNTMPKEVSEKVVKSEFVHDEVAKLMNLRKSFLHAVTDSRPSFNQEESSSITSFLLRTIKEKDVQPPNRLQDEVEKSTSDNSNSTVKSLCCKHCGEKDALVGNYGRFGYYVTCKICEQTTSMKSNCPSCQSKQTKISKKKEVYSLTCLDCSHQYVVLNNA